MYTVGSLTLKDPFMIASSHWTANKTKFLELAPVTPCAVTLKTTSQEKGGDGLEAIGGKRLWHRMIDAHDEEVGRYTDGPKTLELWDVATTHAMSRCAKDILPDALLGLSILQDEDYESIASSLDMGLYQYVELNWKYSFRGIPLSEVDSFLTKALDDLREFIKAFAGLPLLIKLSREAGPFVGLNGFIAILNLMNSVGAGMIVANSKKMRVPPSRIKEVVEGELIEGVVVGEYLFLETYDTIRSLLEVCRQKGLPAPPVVASGGVVDLPGIMDLLAGGACAVQLCTLLDLRGVHVLPLLRSQFQQVVGPNSSAKSFITSLQSQESSRIEAVRLARVVAFDQDALVSKVFSGSEALLPYIDQAIRKELDTKEEYAVTEVGSLPRGLRFVITRGNVSGFLLGERCVRKLHMTPLDFESTAGFAERLADTSFEYDFTILPESVLTYILKNASGLGGRCPVMVGSVGSSFVELVGNKCLDLERTSRVYHFSGNSARRAIAELLRASHSPKPESNEIKGPMLLPLLRYWDAASAVLAKPPLSRFYGLFTPRPEEWGTIWETREPLLLVASKKLAATMNGQDTCTLAYQWLLGEVCSTLKDGLTAAREVLLIREGFLQYCTRLLSRKR